MSNKINKEKCRAYKHRLGIWIEEHLDIIAAVIVLIIVGLVAWSSKVN